MKCSRLLDKVAHTIHVTITKFPSIDISNIMAQHAMAPPPPFECGQGGKIFTIEDLRDKVTELATQLATAIGGKVDHLWQIKGTSTNLIVMKKSKCWSKNGML